MSAGRGQRLAVTKGDRMGESRAAGRDPEGEEPVLESEAEDEKPEERDPKAPRPPRSGGSPPEDPGADTIYQG